MPWTTAGATAQVHCTAQAVSLHAPKDATGWMATTIVVTNNNSNTNEYIQNDIATASDEDLRKQYPQ